MVSPRVVPVEEVADALAAAKLGDGPPAADPAPATPTTTPTLGGVPGVPVAPQAGPLGTRTALPVTEGKTPSFSLWKFIKDAAGESCAGRVCVCVSLASQWT